MKKGLWAVFIAANAVVLFFLFQRARLESSRRTVEVCIDWKDSLALLRERMGVPRGQPSMTLATFLERCRIMGVASAALEEESLASLAESGKIILFDPQEMEKYRALGIVSGDMLSPQRLWVRRDSGVAAQIAAAVKSVSGESVKIRRTGDYSVLESTGIAWSEVPALNAGFDPESLRAVREAGLSVVRRVGESDFNAAVDFSSASVWLFSPDPKNTFSRGAGTPKADPHASLLFYDPAFAERLRQGGDLIALPENDPRVFDPLFETSPALRERVLRSHQIFPDELKTLSPEAVRSRWVRAVRERTCRFLYVRWNPLLSPEDNLVFLRSVLQALKSHGFALRKHPPFPEESEMRPEDGAAGVPFRKARLALAFAIAVLGPLCALVFVRSRLEKTPGAGESPFLPAFRIWSAAVLITLYFALMIPTLLPDASFVSGLDLFRGVKLSLLLPLLAAVFIFFPLSDLRAFLRSRATYGVLILLGFSGIVLLVMLERSGNSASRPQALELALRASLENILSVRPRFKEFFIGHPLLLLGLYLRFSRPEQDASRLLSRGLIWAGTVALVSVTNSFCHLHTPVLLSLLRTFNGFWLGGLLGAGLITAFVRTKNRFFPDAGPDVPPWNLPPKKS